MVGVIVVGIMYHSLESEVILNTVIYSFSHIVCIGGIPIYFRWDFDDHCPQ